MTETTELKNAIMYLSCTIHKKSVRECKNCPNKNDCNLKEEDQEEDSKKMEKEDKIFFIVCTIAGIWIVVFLACLFGVI